MKTGKQPQSEALKVYHLYWDSYTKGDLETFASTLDETFEMIGTSESERCHTKADGIEFLKSQLHEIVGKVEMRNRQIDAITIEHLVLINEQCDIYVLLDSDLSAERPYLSAGRQEWNFYSKIRISTLLRETKEGWKVAQQHGSLPDMRVGEGETIALEKISKENLELRDAVKRRTAELEHKNRELAIEAALEKVRAVAMGMKNPEDMLDVCRVISEQLQQFGVEKIRNVQIAIIDENIGQYLCYQYFTPYDKTTIEKTEYLKSPVEHGMVRQMLASRDGYFIGRLSGKELEDFRIHRKEENHFPDPFLDKATELDYCFLSIGEGGLGLTLYQAMAADVLTLFKRFHQVFSLAYQRFRDIQKAEAQAREAQIEAALEKVRSRSLAMHKSEELNEVVKVLFEKLTELQVPSTAVGIQTFIEGSNDMQAFVCGDVGTGIVINQYRLPYFDHPIVHDYLNAHKNKLEVFVGNYSKKEKDSFYDVIVKLPELKDLAVEVKTMIYNSEFYEVTIVPAEKSLIAVNDFQGNPLAESQVNILKRFAKVFDQTYTRFLDLQKAEAQARAAKIEAALERARTQSMLMKHSDEIKAISNVFHVQLLQLGIPSEFSYVWLPDEANQSHQFWASWSESKSGKETLHSKQVTYPLDKSEPYTAACFAAWAQPEVILEEFIPPSETPGFFEVWQELLAGATKLKADFFPQGIFYSEAYMRYGCFGINIRRQLSEEEKQILKRFSIEFERAYTRFLDLQKAEAQTREAQIEAALERIRAKAMAMHNSEELSDVLTVFFTQFDVLGIKPVQAQLSLFDLENNRFIFRATGKDGRRIIGEQVIDIDAMDIWKETIDKWKRSEPNSINSLHIPKDILPQLWELFEELNKQIPVEDLVTMEDFPDGAYVTEGNFNFGYIGFSHNRKATAEEEDIVIRFATEFGRFYQRFLDLEKAEAQAREAQIQLSLERIRAKALAIQQSDELGDFLTVVFEQFEALNINPVYCHLSFLDIENNRLTFRMTGRTGAAVIATQEIDLDATPLWKQNIEDWKSGNPYEVGGMYIPQESIPEMAEIFKDILSKLPEEERPLPEDFPNGQYVVDAYCKYGYLGYSASKPPSDEEKEITRRIAHEFGNVYQRFLDLQKAEAQAREAQIQLSLERIRAKAMAMQHSDELSDFLTVVFEQFEVLNLSPVNCILSLFDIENNRSTFRMTGKKGATLIASQEINLDASPVWNQKVEDWKSGHPNDVDVLYIPYENLPEIAEIFNEIIEKLPEDERPQIEVDYPNGEYIIDGYCKYGYLGYSASRPPSEEEQEITRRIANEFGNVYQRFLDLQKAESQAREAQIQLALERVRARTMAMQSSEELAEVSYLLNRQVVELGIPTRGCAFNIYNEHDSTEWFSDLEGTLPPYPTPREYIFKKYYEAGQRGESLLVDEFSGDRIKELYQYFASLNNFENEAIDNHLAKAPEYQINHMAYFKYGYLLFVTLVPAPEAHDVFKRFAKEFEQTYTRFLDLQKAEAQAREAQIEAALERVRSRTMAMQKSEELADAAYVLFEQLNILGVTHERINIGIVDEANQQIDFWVTEQGGQKLQTKFSGRISEPTTLSKSYEAWKKGAKSLVVDLNGKELQSWLSYMEEEIKIPFNKAYLHTRRVQTAGFFSKGMLVVTSPEPLQEEAIYLLEKFAKVFDLTYTRFNDLLLAEAQAKEAQIELSLEKIRAQVASMQESTDLLDIMVNIRSEFVALGHEAHYFWYMRWLPEKYEKAMTSGDGTQVGMVMNLPRHMHGDIPLVANWELGEEPTLVFPMEVDMAVAYIDKMITLGDFIQIDPQAPTLDDIRHIGGLTFVMARTSQGEIGYSLPGYVPNPSLEAVGTLARFAGVFDLAYKRFEDLKKAEKDLVEIKEAKKKAEEALVELKATQSQLVQQEKLASLGQLTAGIAHEIKNPLNFVNNFSEVSLELLDEIKETRNKSQETRPKTEEDEIEEEILEDIKANLKKIHEHGSRANGIVTSMLQHSRGGSGKKEPTDLNALIREYVNLSFHGMRAGKNPINVEIALDLVPELGDFPLIKEDFTRVVINLCNNAFDAMREKVKLYHVPRTMYQERERSDLKYLPKLRVSTLLENGQIRIAFEDNGPGIPDEIKDKILQPFFTTKKGTEGTGLGLSITHDIVKAHGGELKVETKLGEGTAFIIDLEKKG
jgi:signal transduction histidine kinase